MESDDEFQFLPPEESPPPGRLRKLKRLKKADGILNIPISNPVNEELLMTSLVSPRSETVEASETLVSGSSDELLRETEGLNGESELNYGDALRSVHGRSGVKKALAFDENEDGRSGLIEEEIADMTMKKPEKKRLNLEGSIEEKAKRKRIKSANEYVKPKETASMKRKAEKERKAYLEQLHAESQRLLRESRDAAFKPLPIVQKPISAVLDKIRQRKLEVSKKSVTLKSDNSSDVSNNYFKEATVENDPTNKGGDDKIAEATSEGNGALDDIHINKSHDLSTHSEHENVPSEMEISKVESKHNFRAPLDDTQDLFCGSQASEKKDDLSDNRTESPLEEDFGPSLLALNLKLDSAPPDDFCSDEEDNNKENVDPHPERVVNACSSPIGDPVKAFVDDEAVEEDDSDNDLIRFQEDGEDEDDRDFEELNDMIATDYKEKSIDEQRRNELHQKWLEQQDAAGTENLLQRLNCGLKQKVSDLFEERDDKKEGDFCNNDDDDDDDYGGDEDDDDEDIVPRNIARINARKVKQMMPQMFTDNDDTFLSSDDEETEKRLVKQRLLEEAEKQATFLSPVEDENSREVFGLIKKLNIAADTKKKAKSLSFFENMLTGGNSNSSSRSSFLGRSTNHSMRSTCKHGPSKTRGFIFGQDDSNSRSAISLSEDSSDMIEMQNQSTMNASTKFSYSQLRSSTQNTKNAVETVSSTSLFELLRHSSVQSNHCKKDNVVGQTQTVFAAFRSTKN